MGTPPLQRGSKVKLHIDRLSVGGRGVGRVAHLVVFVPDVCVGEDVEAEVTFVKKNYAEARLLSIEIASPNRAKPPCPVAGVCGGCNWQHLDYPEQLKWKRELVRESLRKFSGFDVSAEASVLPVEASPRTLRYRNRVQFHCANGAVGYFKRGSHALVSIEDCPIAENLIAEQIPILRERFRDTQGRIEVFVAEDGSVQIRGGLAGDDEGDNKDDGGMSFAFSQVNTQQNQNLIAMVVAQFVQRFIDTPAPAIVELYAGSGNFTFALAKAFPKSSMTAVEFNRESVTRALAISKLEYANHDIRWVQGDVGLFVTQNSIPTNAGVLLDPPRSGCDVQVVEALAASKASFIIYVSCHPVTLARDLKYFYEKGWSLELAQPLDMFPQTDHVETLTVLTRRTSV